MATIPSSDLVADEEVADEDSGIAGSCTCDCPPNMGYGYCFNVPPDALPPSPPVAASEEPKAWPPPSKCTRLKLNSAVARKIRSAADYCPALGQTISCDPSKDTNTTALCNAGGHSRASGCQPLRGCGSFPGMSNAFAVATCSCPVHPSFEPCAWSDSPCIYSPYYLPG